jgi:hypothetical protein
MSVSPSTIGVAALYRLPPRSKKISQTCLPSAALIATMPSPTWPMMSFVSPTVMSMGEEYDVGAPLHFHFCSPVFSSYATTEPSSLPSCAMASPSTMIGEAEW